MFAVSYAAVAAMDVEVSRSAVERFITAAQILVCQQPAELVDRSRELRELAALIPAECSVSASTRLLVVAVLTRVICGVEIAGGCLNRQVGFVAIKKLTAATDAESVRGAFSQYLHDTRRAEETQHWRVELLLRIISRRSCDSSISVSSVAEEANVSVSQVQRLLRRHTHKSFRRHIKDFRMLTITDLLANTPLSIKEIAARCGYSCTRALDRQFHGTFGMTPGEWRTRAVESL